MLEIAETLKRKTYREGLTEHRDLAELSKELVTIETDLDFEFDPAALALEEPDGEALYELYRELDFFSLLEELESQGVSTAGIEMANATECRDVEQWRDSTAALGAEITIGVVGGPEPVGLCVGLGDGESLFADFRTEGLREAVQSRRWRSG